MPSVSVNVLQEKAKNKQLLLVVPLPLFDLPVARTAENSKRLTRNNKKAPQRSSRLAPKRNTHRFSSTEAFSPPPKPSSIYLLPFSRTLSFNTSLLLRFPPPYHVDRYHDSRKRKNAVQPNPFSFMIFRYLSFYKFRTK